MNYVSRSFAVALLVSGTATAQAPAKPAEPPFTTADVEFMQDMMHHHAQALTLCAMAPSHSAAAPVATFCKRVLISQRDEIEVMSTWLKKRGQESPEVEGHHHSGMDELEHSAMPGMLTPAQLRELDAATGPVWDRLFLQDMIKHHEGALVMVKKLFDSAGAGQASEIFGIASGVEADQRAEIDRMRGMLASMVR